MGLRSRMRAALLNAVIRLDPERAEPDPPDHDLERRIAVIAGQRDRYRMELAGARLEIEGLRVKFQTADTDRADAWRLRAQALKEASKVRVELEDARAVLDMSDREEVAMVYRRVVSIVDRWFRNSRSPAHLRQRLIGDAQEYLGPNAPKFEANP